MISKQHDNRPTSCLVDNSTLTDLHSSSAEVEIISLLGEDLPRYKLRADNITRFGGYGNEDFCLSDDPTVIQTPVLAPVEVAAKARGLTNEQAEAALDYFVSCGDRLSQMTKTYQDVEAVTR